MVDLSPPIDFLCPISLELMRDPVTLSTGQTFDRMCIEQWFETGHHTCPSTMRVIDHNDLAPNRTLQRLIRRWCVCNNFSVAAVPQHRHRRHASTPDLAGARDRQLAIAEREDAEHQTTATANGTATTTWRQLKEILQQVALGIDLHGSLKKLKVLAMDSNHRHENRNVFREAGAVPILARFAFSPENLSKDLLESCEIALAIVTVLLPSEKRTVRSAPTTAKLVPVDSKKITAISWFLNRGSLDARANAASVLASLCQEDEEVKLLVGATPGVFEGLVQLLKEDLYPKARDNALKAVVAIISGLGKNTVRAVDAGVVFAVAEMLPDAERRGQDRPLTELLELLCTCAEGREALSKHGLIVPMLVTIINRRDVLAAESAVSCLWTVCQFYPQKCVDEAAGQAGILIQLWQFCHADDRRVDPHTKLRAADLFRQVQQRMKDCNGKS